MYRGHDEYSAAVDYYCRIMTNDDVLMLNSLVRKIPRAPGKVRQYLERNCRNVKDLEYFFKENLHLFFVENGRVALFQEELDTAAELTVRYFQAVLENYEEPVHFMTLKTEHLNADVPEVIINFITRFYPCKEFKHFLRSRPDVFVVYPDHTVFLIEVETVAFFEKRLEIFGRQGLRFIDFRGHVGQASTHVQEYVNRYYPGDEFQVFLGRHSDVFQIDEVGCVSLVPLT